MEAIVIEIIDGHAKLSLNINKLIKSELMLVEELLEAALEAVNEAIEKYEYDYIY